MKEIGNFIGRLSSRKFLLTLAGFVIIYLRPDIAAQVTTLVGIFVGGEGAADAVSRYAVEKFKPSSTTDATQITGAQDDEFTGTILPGNEVLPANPSVATGGDFPL